MGIVQGHTLLGSDKHEASSKFQKKLFNLCHKSLFQIAFQHGFVLRHTQKLEHIGITDDVSWLADLNPFLSQRKNLFFIHIFTGKQQPFIQRAVNLPFQLPN